MVLLLTRNVAEALMAHFRSQNVSTKTVANYRAKLKIMNDFLSTHADTCMYIIGEEIILKPYRYAAATKACEGSR